MEARDATLSPRHYLSPDIFTLERERLFSRLWIFAGLKSLVAEPDAYIARRVAGVPVVVQNFDGKLRAFENICAHRQNPVQPEGFGRRPLVCGYHGWRYDRAGKAATIPLHDEHYAFGEQTRRALGLQVFRLAEIGGLIFINLSPDPLPIEEQFSGPILQSLESVSTAFDNEVLVAQWRVAHNWKLAYENLRDGLHPRFVHTRTLATEVSFEPPRDLPQEQGGLPALAALSYGGAEGQFRQARSYGFHQHVERWGTENAYFNWLIYPNTHVLTSDGGFSFSIEHHDPVSPVETELTAYFMTAKKKRPWQGSAATLLGYAQGAKVILDEDIAVMEAIQRGLHDGAPRPTVGQYERENRRVAAWYAHAMDDTTG